MVIDQVKSFIVNTDGSSKSYFDPTIRTETQTVSGSTTTGASVNLGAVAGALGVGGAIGTLARGVNVGGANTNTVTNTATTMIADQQQVSLGPHGSIAMSKTFKLIGVGKNAPKSNYVDLLGKNSLIRFSICITYSVDNGKTFDKLVTDFAVTTNLSFPVVNGKVSDAFASIYKQKKDALAEPMYMFYVNNNIAETTNVYDLYKRGVLVDWQ